jgi:hypothetical protein
VLLSSRFPFYYSERPKKVDIDRSAVPEIPPPLAKGGKEGFCIRIRESG